MLQRTFPNGPSMAIPVSLRTRPFHPSPFSPSFFPCTAAYRVVSPSEQVKEPSR